jgi:NitT/TauT family transport system ATP-binding protein
MNTDEPDRVGVSLIPEKTAAIYCRHLSFCWPGDSNDETEVLREVSFAARPGEFVSIIGPSGCGKSTLLNILCGLLPPGSGEVGVGERSILQPTREVGIVFQDADLFPWLSVQGNVEFGMKMKGIPRRERQQVADTILRKVGLWNDRDRYPHQLSGGMKQRVSIARVLANDSEVLLMDEPFAALDYQTRFLMQRFLLDIWKQFQKTIIFVTHQVDEAILLSDRILLMTARPGQIAEELKVELQRPRETATVKFNDVRARITVHLEREVMRLCGEKKGDSHLVPSVGRK